ncbi:MAG TPA: methyltransferase domain-containing protein [Steroidobacteraceae bacterium]
MDDVIDGGGAPLVPREPSEPDYVLGHLPDEIGRLMTQAAILRPLTERMLRSAGLEPGMRVLDLGCGAGDVFMLVAQLVGPSGAVVGIDRSAQALAIAGGRAQAVHLDNIAFKEGALDSYGDAGAFDCVVGRYVLVHQADPAAFLHTAARFLRGGGILAFHEIDVVHIPGSCPPVRSWDAAMEMINSAARYGVPSYDAGVRMIEHFFHAGLPQPTMFCDVPIGSGENSPLYAWVADTLRSFSPQLVRMGILADEGAIGAALEAQLRTAVVTAHSQIAVWAQMCAWARL